MADRKTLLLRVRPQLYDALRRWAADEFRSVNGQIEYLLHRALLEAGRLPADPSAPDGERGAPPEKPPDAAH